MMQPYRFAPRFALTSSSSPSCLDPPIRACESPPRRRWRNEVLVALAGASLVVGVATLAAPHIAVRDGHVEIGPAALHHARREPRPKPPAPAPALTAPEPTASVVVAQAPLLRGVHGDKALLARAKTLASLGLDVTVVDVSLPPATSSHAFDKVGLSTAAIFGDDGKRLGALRIIRETRGSALQLAGLRFEDEIIGIDGYALRELDIGDASIGGEDIDHVRARGSVIVEVARGEHHIVFSIHWR